MHKKGLGYGQADRKGWSPPSPAYGQLFVKKKILGSIWPQIMIKYEVKQILTRKNFTKIFFAK